MDDFFTDAGLKRLLAAIRGNCAVFPLRDHAGQPGIILRHDVDLDMDAAWRLAEIEAEAGIRSTFFFLVTAETYNVAAPSSRAILRRMADDGFEVALHFDPQVYSEADDQALAAHARAEGDILAGIIGAPVNSVSLHNPSVHGRYLLLDGWANAYDPAIFAPDRYLSDSRMSFGRNPLGFIAEGRTRTLQLLLHPLHYTPAGLRYPGPMLNYLEAAARRVNTMFSVNSAYRERVGDGLLAAIGATLGSWRL